MDAKEAVSVAKRYAAEMFSDEPLVDLGLEEIDHDAMGHFLITLSFSRPWNTPKSRAQEALERMGAFSPLKRSYKVFQVGTDGQVVSMKSRGKVDAAE